MSILSLPDGSELLKQVSPYMWRVQNLDADRQGYFQRDLEEVFKLGVIWARDNQESSPKAKPDESEVKYDTVPYYRNLLAKREADLKDCYEEISSISSRNQMLAGQINAHDCARGIKLTAESASALTRDDREKLVQKTVNHVSEIYAEVPDKNFTLIAQSAAELGARRMFDDLTAHLALSLTADSEITNSHEPEDFLTPYENELLLNQKKLLRNKKKLLKSIAELEVALKLIAEFPNYAGSRDQSDRLMWFSGAFFELRSIARKAMEGK